MEGRKGRRRKSKTSNTQKGKDDYLHDRILQPSLGQEYGGARCDHSQDALVVMEGCTTTCLAFLFRRARRELQGQGRVGLDWAGLAQLPSKSGLGEAISIGCQVLCKQTDVVTGGVCCVSIWYLNSQ